MWFLGKKILSNLSSLKRYIYIIVLHFKDEFIGKIVI